MPFPSVAVLQWISNPAPFSIQPRDNCSDHTVLSMFDT